MQRTESQWATPTLTLAGWSQTQSGSDAAVVGLHGWLDNANTWNALAPFVSGTFHSLDLRGHGLSEHVAGAYHIWDSVLDLRAVIQSIGQPVILLGHSMGAGIASLYAGIFPEDVQQLWLVEGFGPWVEPHLSPRGQLRRAAIKQSELPSHRPYPSLDVATRIRAAKGVTPVTEQAIRPVVERGMRQTEQGWVWRADPWLRLASPLKMEPHQVESCLVGIECPVKIALGTRGMLNPSAMLNERLAWVPHAEHRLFAGDHHLHLSPETARLIADWFVE